MIFWRRYRPGCAARYLRMSIPAPCSSRPGGMNSLKPSRLRSLFQHSPFQHSPESGGSESTMATVFMYSGGELVRVFGRVDDNSVTRQNDHTLSFKFFDMGLGGIPDFDDATCLDPSVPRLPRF